MSELSAVVLAAGLGTRMKSALPKVLHEVLGRPMVFYVLDAALAAGAEQIVIVVGHGREVLEERVRAAYPDARIDFALQAEQRGTGHAVMCALEAVSPTASDVLVLSGDVPNLGAGPIEDLLVASRGAEPPVGLLSAEVDDPTGYGRIVRGELGNVLRIVEDSDASALERSICEINSGTYLFDAAFLREAMGGLSDDNAQGELYLTDLVAKAAEGGQPAVALVVGDADAALGVNTRADLARAEALMRSRRNLALMQQGVTMRAPQQTFVDADVEVAADVTLEPGVMLFGSTRIGARTVVEAGCVVRDSVVGEDVQLLAYSHLERSEVGNGCRVGPFGRLRPGSRLLEGARIGNFVEMKNTTLGVGSKANHLTYLGDATIGSGVNVGAGTITCNYDGKKKYPTVIEDGVFIGSDTQLIAPVTLHKDAYIGAGTTVTADVPAGALAITRAERRTIEGYVERKRRKWREGSGS